MAVMGTRSHWEARTSGRGSRVRGGAGAARSAGVSAWARWVLPAVVSAVVVTALVFALSTGAMAVSTPVLDGAVSTITADGVASASVAHTIGTGIDRLVVVGVSANSYSAARTVSSVTFTPLEGSSVPLVPVGSVENGAGRLSAIYSLLPDQVALASGASGTVTVTFSGVVDNGVAIGVANFAGVSQVDPFDGFVSAVGTTTGISLSVPCDPGDLVFDSVFLGYSPTPPAATVGNGQSQLWDVTSDRARGVASTKEATESTTSMNWTAGSTCNWAIAAAPINPSGEPPDPPSLNILLGRPTDTSVTANIICGESGEAYIEYGTVSGTYPDQIAPFACVADEPVEVVVDGLSGSTEYFYRVQLKPAGWSEWIPGDEYSFRTQRAPGETFTFTIISDSHLGQYGGQTADQLALYTQALLNAQQDDPDFHIDLGDTFAMDPSPLGTGMTEAEARAAYYVQRPYMGLISHSTPIFLVLGNHENEEGWNWDDIFTAPDQSLALVGMKYRKLFYPNPIPDGFYTGNTDPLPAAFADATGDANHEDYYAWTWGDALFVVLDPYHYSMTWPDDWGQGYGGEGQDGEVGGDRWDWTLGYQQYQWFKETLENSEATYKFVFIHNKTGGDNPYGRGGADSAPYFEWGGLNWDGTWGFDTERPGWETPIHQLMVENGVSIFFHGHDHAYAYEELDGIVYQECPKPDEAIPPETSYLVESEENGGDHYPGALTLPASGHMRVTVSPSGVTVDYVKCYLPGQGTNGEIAHSYSLPLTYDLTYTAGVGGALIGSTTQTVYYNGSGTAVTAVPGAGYHFVQWSDGSTANPRTDTNVSADITVGAVFALNTYTITASAGTGGSISPSGAVSVTHGTSQVFAITPATGYHVADVLVDDASVGAVSTYEFTNVTTNHTIAATFALNTYALSYSAGIGGTLIGSTTQTVSYGDSGTAVTAVPGAGYHFVEWRDGAGANPRTETNVTGNITVTAVFALNAYTITASAGAGGSISPSGAVSVGHGGSQSFAITPAAGYHVADVLVDGASVGTVSSYTFTDVTTNHTIATSFALNTYTITASAGPWGAISPSGVVSVSHGGSLTFAFTPASGYHVAGVLVDGSSVGSLAGYTFSSVTSAHTISVTFALNVYTITASAGTGGSITPSGAVSVGHGGTQSFTITPDTGYQIADVLVDGTSVGAVTSYPFVVVTASHTIAASFAPITYTLTYSAGAGGSISGASPQTVAYGASGSAVTAVPAAGFHFVKWSDDSTTNPRTDTNVTANLSVSANFASNEILYASIRGAHRYETAQMISQAMFPAPLPAGAGVVVAPGETFQEALCGAPLAAAYGGPVLLTSQVGLENGTRAELQRLDPDYVFVIGLSTSVFQEVIDATPEAILQTSIPGPAIGNPVYAMSRLVALELEFKLGDMSDATAIVTVGTNFPDAIGVAPLACVKLWPILLTDQPDGSPLQAEAAAALADLGITEALKVGTYATLPLTISGIGNLSGADRYITNANVAAWAAANAGLTFAHTAVATGDKFPDALASGPYLAKDDGILLLSPLLGPLPPVIANLVTAHRTEVGQVSLIACIEPVIGQVKALLP